MAASICFLSTSYKLQNSFIYWSKEDLGIKDAEKYLDPGIPEIIKGGGTIVYTIFSFIPRQYMFRKTDTPCFVTQNSEKKTWERTSLTERQKYKWMDTNMKRDNWD